jgi:hypothetical protein
MSQSDRWWRETRLFDHEAAIGFDRVAPKPYVTFQAIDPIVHGRNLRAFTRRPDGTRRKLGS